MIKWNEYLVARKSGVKKFWKPLLEKNICHFESLQGERLKVEIHEMCIEYFDNGCTKIPIQHPRILAKVLDQWADEIASNNEKYLLWVYKAIDFKDVHKIVQLENPKQLLEKVLGLNPDNYEAKKLLLLNRINALDFALHELPNGLVLNESVCINAIEMCEKILAENPELGGYKTRFGGNFDYYKNLYFSWIEYNETGFEEDFFQWFNKKI